MPPAARGDDPRGSPDWMELEPGEAVQLRARPSRNLYLAVVGLAFALMILVSAGAILGQQARAGWALSFGLVLGTVALVVWVHLVLERHDYVVTNRRVGARTGVVDQQTTTVPLEEVGEVRARSPLWIRPFALGHVVFLGEEGEPRASFGHVEDPQALLGRIAPVVGGDPVA